MILYCSENCAQAMLNTALLWMHISSVCFCDCTPLVLGVLLESMSSEYILHRSGVCSPLSSLLQSQLAVMCPFKLTCNGRGVEAGITHQRLSVYVHSHRSFLFGLSVASAIVAYQHHRSPISCWRSYTFALESTDSARPRLLNFVLYICRQLPFLW